MSVTQGESSDGVQGTVVNDVVSGSFTPKAPEPNWSSWREAILAIFQRHGHRIQQLFRWGLTLSLLAYFIHWSMDRSEWPIQIHAFQWNFLAWCLLTVPIGLAMRVWKWYVLLHWLEPSVSYRQAFRSHFGAMPLGLLSPGRLGELSRVIFLPQPSLRSARGVGLAAVEKYTDFVAVAIWSVPGLLLLLGPKWAIAGAAAVILLLPVKAYAGGLTRAANSMGKSRFSLLRQAGYMTTGLAGGASIGTTSFTKALIIGCAAYGIEWCQCLFMLRFFGAENFDLAAVAGIMALATLVNSIPITIGGLGVREGAAALWLSGLGIPAHAAVSASLAVFVFTEAIPALAGLSVRPCISATKHDVWPSEKSQA